MKQYVVDELRHQDYEKIKACLDGKYDVSEIGGIYWVPLEQELLTQKQAAHTDCHPIYFIIDLQPAVMSCELLLRTRSKMRCDCMSYASEKQRNWIIRLIDNLLEELEIKI
jgi:hypothetical protein